MEEINLESEKFGENAKKVKNFISYLEQVSNSEINYVDLDKYIKILSNNKTEKILGLKLHLEAYLQRKDEISDIISSYSFIISFITLIIALIPDAPSNTFIILGILILGIVATILFIYRCKNQSFYEKVYIVVGALDKILESKNRS